MIRRSKIIIRQDARIFFYWSINGLNRAYETSDLVGEKDRFFCVKRTRKKTGEKTR